MTDIFGLVFPLILLLHYKKSQASIVPSVAWPYCLLVLWMLFSSILHITVYGTELYIAAKQFFRLLNGFAAFLIFPYFFKSGRDLNQLVNAFLISTVFPISQAILLLLGFGDVFGLNVHHVSGDVVMLEGVYGNIGVFATAGVFGTLALISKAGVMTKSTAIKSAYIGWFIVCVALALATLSRMIVINLLIIILTFGGLLAVRKRFKLLALLVGSFVLLSTSSLFIQSYEGIRLRSEGEIEVWQGNRPMAAGLHGRVGRWDRGMSRFVEDYGIVEQLVGTDIVIGPHGDYFYWLFSYGVGGLCLYLLFFYRLLTQCVRYMRFVRGVFLRYYATMVVASILVWLTTAIITTPSFMPDYSYFVLGNAGIFLAVVKRHRALNKIRRMEESKSFYRSPALSMS